MSTTVTISPSSLGRAERGSCIYTHTYIYTQKFRERETRRERERERQGERERERDIGQIVCTHLWPVNLQRRVGRTLPGIFLENFSGNFLPQKREANIRRPHPQTNDSRGSMKILASNAFCQKGKGSKKPSDNRFLQKQFAFPQWKTSCFKPWL